MFSHCFSVCRVLLLPTSASFLLSVYSSELTGYLHTVPRVGVFLGPFLFVIRHYSIVGCSVVYPSLATSSLVVNHVGETTL